MASLSYILCEVNVSDIADQADLEARVKAASFIGTLQAGYTDFHYLRPIWQRTTEKDALIGVSMTGIGSGAILKADMKAAAKVVKEENKRVADCDPDYDWFYGISSPSRVGNPLYQPLYDVCSPTYKGHEDLTSSPPSSGLSPAVSLECPFVATNDKGCARCGT